MTRIFLILSSFACFAFFPFCVLAVPRGQLPDNAEPLLYRLELQIDPEKDRFAGSVAIDIQLKEELNGIWIHGRNLAVKRCSLRDAKGNASGCSYRQVHEDGIARVDFGAAFKPQTVRLSLDYQAPFDSKLQGLYRVHEDGRSYAFTQFEAIYARLCFPGFDEPRFKTPFDIVLTVKSEDAAITTTLPLEEKKLPDGRKQFRYGRTQKLPTYLIAFAVGPFDVVEAPNIPPNAVRKEPVPLRGVAVRGKGTQLQYMLSETGEMLAELEGYFGLPYAFEKMDLIAVPDFDWGAMENAGAITFRESLLLLDERATNPGRKKSMVSVLAHELAHQWFGNLVTLQWWSDIWLNEGFTSWITAKVVDRRHPEWKATVSAVESAHSVMKSDSLESARPLHRKIETASEIYGIADGIIFTKGAAVLRMFEHYIGEETFQEVMRRYLNDHKFASVSSRDFLAVFASVAGKRAAESLETFVFQAGLPMISAEYSCVSSSAQITLSQKPYYSIRSSPHPGGPQKWKVPVCLQFPGNGKEDRNCLLLEESQQTFPLPQCASWVMPDADGAGYYRWTLSAENYRMIRPHLLSDLSEREQISMADSLKAALESADIHVAEYLAETSPLAASTERSVVVSPMPVLEFLKKEVLDARNEESLKEFSRALYAPAFDRLGFEGDSREETDNTLLRRDVISFLAFVAEDPEVRAEVSKRGGRFAGFGADKNLHPEAVDSTLADIALGVAVQENGAAFHELLIRHLKDTSDSNLREDLLSAIAKTRDAELVAKTLSLVPGQVLRVNERVSLLHSLMYEKQNRVPVWNWLKENFDLLRANISEPDAGSLPLVASRFCKNERADEVQRFFESKLQSLPGGEQKLKQAVETIRECAVRAEAQQKSANAFFSNR